MRLIVFDVDGTLVDSSAIILEAQYRTCAALGMAHPGRRAGLDIVGLSLPEAFRALLGEEAPADALTEEYKRQFNELRADPVWHEPLFPGAAETIRGLSARPDVMLGIATGKSRRGVAYILDRFDWHGVFTTIQTADDAPSKPHPAMLEQAMAEVGAGRQATVMIGDSVHDARMAKAAGVAMLGVGWGFQPPEWLMAEGASVILDRWEALHDHLPRLAHGGDMPAIAG